jgi:hypothetical protein
MPFSWMCRRVGLLQTDVSEECFASIFRVDEVKRENYYKESRLLGCSAVWVYTINRRFGGTFRFHLQGKRSNVSEENDYEESRFLGCAAVSVYYKLTFRRNISPPSSGQKK